MTSFYPVKRGDYWAVARSDEGKADIIVNDRLSFAEANSLVRGSSGGGGGSSSSRGVRRNQPPVQSSMGTSRTRWDDSKAPYVQPRHVQDRLEAEFRANQRSAFEAEFGTPAQQLRSSQFLSGLFAFDEKRRVLREMQGLVPNFSRQEIREALRATQPTNKPPTNKPPTFRTDKAAQTYLVAQLEAQREQLGKARGAYESSGETSSNTRISDILRATESPGFSAFAAAVTNRESADRKGFRVLVAKMHMSVKEELGLET